MRRFNSTIQVKKKVCNRCGLPKYIFSKGRCQDCARIEDVMNAMDEEGEEEIEREGLAALIKEADEIYSKWLRRSSADKDGFVTCFTCDSRLRWQAAQCGHYIKRGHLYFRFDHRNTKIQDEECNVFKGGNYPEFTKRLEAESPGITEYLMTEANLVYKPTRDEIRGIINEYSIKYKKLLK